MHIFEYVVTYYLIIILIWEVFLKQRKNLSFQNKNLSTFVTFKVVKCIKLSKYLTKFRKVCNGKLTWR